MKEPRYPFTTILGGLPRAKINSLNKGKKKLLRCHESDCDSPLFKNPFQCYLLFTLTSSKCFSRMSYNSLPTKTVFGVRRLSPHSVLSPSFDRSILPKLVLQCRSGASSFKFPYLILYSRSSSSCLRLILCLPITFILPFSNVI
jgi:hypothetical protein